MNINDYIRREKAELARAEALYRAGVEEMKAMNPKKAYVKPNVERVTDAELGISLRFVKSYDVKADSMPTRRQVVDAWTEQHWRMCITSKDEDMLRERGISPK